MSIKQFWVVFWLILRVHEPKSAHFAMTLYKLCDYSELRELQLWINLSDTPLSGGGGGGGEREMEGGRGVWEQKGKGEGLGFKYCQNEKKLNFNPKKKQKIFKKNTCWHVKKC